MPIITKVKKKPIPTTTPYPTACGNTVETVSDMVKDDLRQLCR